jgi:hypothetical protein
LIFFYCSRMLQVVEVPNFINYKFSNNKSSV